MEKKVLIVDSDRKQIERIVAIVKKVACNLGKRVVLFSANNVSRAEILLKRYDIDVMLLDIVYKETYAGISLIKCARAMDKYAMLPIIIITDAGKMKEYSYKTLLCYGFCEKNCPEEKISLLLKTALKYSTAGEEDKQIIIRKKGVLYPVLIRDILYIRVAEHKLCLFLEKGEEIGITNLTMNRFYEQYSLQSLVRCNRNIMVNCIHVERVDLEERYIVIKGSQEKIRIGPAYLENVKTGFYIKEDGSIIV